MIHIINKKRIFCSFACLTPLLLRTTFALPAHPRALPGASTRKVEMKGEKLHRLFQVGVATSIKSLSCSLGVWSAGASQHSSLTWVSGTKTKGERRPPVLPPSGNPSRLTYPTHTCPALTPHPVPPPAVPGHNPNYRRTLTKTFLKYLSWNSVPLLQRVKKWLYLRSTIQKIDLASCQSSPPLFLYSHLSLSSPSTPPNLPWTSSQTIKLLRNLSPQVPHPPLSQNVYKNHNHIMTKIYLAAGNKVFPPAPSPYFVLYRPASL